MPEIERSEAMSGQFGKRARCLVLPVLALAATAARADQAVNYVVSGPAGAAVWKGGSPLGAEVVAFAFTQVAPAKGETPAPGPRVVFSATQVVSVNGVTVWRQWYGDAAIKPEWLAIAPDLSSGTLDATVTGTLEERTTAGGVVVHRDVPGRLQLSWTAQGGLANTTTAYTYQTPAYTTVLQTVGPGRAATATATVTVDALGPAFGLTGLGSLSSVTSGLVSVTMQ
jgi:hypothetical protein